MSIPFQISIGEDVLSGRRARSDEAPASVKEPLIVALHGGGYTSAFFDIPGYSLLDRAAAAGCTAVAFNRPGYGGSTLLTNDALLSANATVLGAGISELWKQDGGTASGVFIVGHSIGAAIAILMAAHEQPWPLLGIAVSGVGLTLPPGGPVFVPDAGTVRLSVPAELKNLRMFGPEGTYPAGVPERLAVANEPVVYREIFEINTLWSGYARDVLAQVRVPVHYRQGSLDQVWAQGEHHVEDVRSAFSVAPRVDAAIVRDAAHCIDFHHAGEAFQQSQITFARACAGQQPF